MNHTQSLLDYMQSFMVDGKLPEDFSLPPLHEDENELLFADGARDGIEMYHMNPPEIKKEDYERMVEAIQAINEHDFEKAEELFNTLAKDNRALSIGQELLDYIYSNKDTIKPGNLYEFGVGLIGTTNNRECVKYGLLLLEPLVVKNDATKNTIRTLALSDEFTLYCIRNMNKWENGNDEIFEIAKKVHGWGRIHAVEYLRALDPRYEEIRDWILKEGINNTVMPSYSALTCWKNVNLGGILYTNPTREQFTYLGRIIDAMLDESAVAGISTLDKREDILLKYFEKAQGFTLTIEDYQIIYNIQEYALDHDLKEVSATSKKMLSTMDAKTKILNAVKKGEALELANEVGIDVKPHVLQLIRNDFKKYYHLCHYIVQDKVYRSILLNLFKKELPLEEMKTQPTLSFGLGEEYWKESALEFLMQDLRHYPLEGQEFIEVGLQAKPSRTRNGALKVLKDWVFTEQEPLIELLPSFYELLLQLKEIEPNEGTKEMMEQLLRGDITSEEKTYELKEPLAYSQETLNILADAISDIGVWQWWFIDENVVQLEFGAVQIYDHTKPKKGPHSSTIALRFKGNAFALFLDEKKEAQDKEWYTQLANDEIEPFDLEGFALAFNDDEYVNKVMERYPNKTVIKDRIHTAKYIVAGECNDVGFVVGGDELEVLTHNGSLNEKDIKEGSERWWEYWKDYWDKRGTKDAYEKDYVCEVTIPVKE